MELRRDPVTQTWIIQEDTEATWSDTEVCPLCPGHEALSSQTIYEYLDSEGWRVRVTPHPRPLYRIEGEAERRAEGLYDRMRNLGAHEIVVENRDHNMPLSLQADEDFAQVLRAYVSRLRDLKKDKRFRYVTVFRNQGAAAGQDFAHPHSQITATPFIPRRVGYELRSVRRHFEQKERCLICDIVRQERAQQVRLVEWDDQFVAFCPFASRVPYETWVLPIKHHFAFEEDLASWDRQLRFAHFLKSVLRRLEYLAPAYHLVLHTAPNLSAKFEKSDNWQTVVEDYHWHLEILPVVEAKSKSYVLKEVYYNSLRPELAAQDLRKVGA
jgi:UDPglucose--hexose-1-phosphate uridylyltransferase